MKATVTFSAGDVEFCHEGLNAACVHVGASHRAVRANIEELLPDVLEGRIGPGRVVGRTVGLDGVPDGRRAMADRQPVKVMVKP
ncbi:MAG TPA: hypothetical protein VFG42_09225 [Baekduia sp.]|nr:hypothetical protein [Baekduia sp.]HET6506958.1 hypothetical protein [Baekduia sp.]